MTDISPTDSPEKALPLEEGKDIENSLSSEETGGKPEEEEDKKKEPGKGKKILSWFLAFALAFVFLSLLRWFVLEPFVVVGRSMEPTFHTGEIIVVDKISPVMFPISRGEIVVFRHPQSPRKKLIKRVIGIGGDEVFLRQGRVFLNGVELEEKYIVQSLYLSNYGPVFVPPNHYFVLGDNRANSTDSRQGWLVAYENLVGGAVVRIFPLNKFSGL